jgi:hypothetical protein
LCLDCKAKKNALLSTGKFFIRGVLPGAITALAKLSKLDSEELSVMNMHLPKNALAVATAFIYFIHKFDLSFRDHSSTFFVIVYPVLMLLE